MDGASGFFQAAADHDLTIQASVLGGTLPGSDFIGGTVDLDAGNDINILNNPEGSTVVLDVSGESRFGSYGLYGGPGGYGFFDAGGDITVGDRPCPAGTHIVLERGAEFGPIVAGPAGALLFELMLGDPRSVPADPEGFARLCAARGIEPLPNPPIEVPAFHRDRRRLD